MGSPASGDAEKGMAEKQPRPSSVTVVDRNVPDLSTKKGTIDYFETVPDDEGEIAYRTLKWWQAGMLMLAETVSLGVLSIPSVFAAIGFVGGILTVLLLGIFATYTGYNIGLFKKRYPGCNNMADAGMILGGPIAREFLGGAQIIFLVFIAASHTLTGQIALDTIAGQGKLCAVVWSVIIAAVSFFCTLPRTFKGIAHLSIISFISASGDDRSLLTSADHGGRADHHDRPRCQRTSRPDRRGGDEQLRSGLPGSHERCPYDHFEGSRLPATIFAYAGHAAFLQFISEMSDPGEFNKALVTLQVADTTVYLVVGIVVYVYVGSDVSSPAISNLGRTLARIAYGIAIPTIIIAGVINASVAAKLTMHRIYNRNGVPSVHFTHNTVKGWITWIGIVASIWILGFLLAEVIPFFSDMLSIIASLFASIFTWAISGIFWLHLNPRSTWFSSPGRSALASVNLFLVVMGLFIMVAGLYASIQSISEGYTSGKFGTPFTCTAPGTG